MSCGFPSYAVTDAVLARLGFALSLLFCHGEDVRGFAENAATGKETQAGISVSPMRRLPLQFRRTREQCW
jgi:hypothetical protein